MARGGEGVEPPPPLPDAPRARVQCMALLFLFHGTALPRWHRSPGRTAQPPGRADVDTTYTRQPNHVPSPRTVQAASVEAASVGSRDAWAQA